MKLKHKLKNNGQLREAVLRKVQSNHIWIDACSLIRPTDETLRNIGAQVVLMLKHESNLLPAYHGERPGAPISSLQSLTPVLYIGINQS